MTSEYSWADVTITLADGTVLNLDAKDVHWRRKDSIGYVGKYEARLDVSTVTASLAPGLNRRQRRALAVRTRSMP